MQEDKFKKDKLIGSLYNEIKNAYPNMYSTERAETIAKEMGYKISNYERRCRELCEAGLIRMIKNEKGFIMGYIYQEKPNYQMPEAKPKQNQLFTPGLKINY